MYRVGLRYFTVLATIYYKKVHAIEVKKMVEKLKKLQKIEIKKVEIVVYNILHLKNKFGFFYFFKPS